MPNEIFTVIAPMKNEGPFIVEWVAHQKALGFDHIIVCTNDCEDGTVELLQALQEQGLVRHHATRVWPRAGIQRSALKQAKRYREYKSADWVFVCDVDEFLNIRVGDGSVRALVEHNCNRAGKPDADVISVPWRIYGPDQIADFRELPVTDQFLRCEDEDCTRPEARKFKKSLFTGKERFWRVGIHAPIPSAAFKGQLNVVLPDGTPAAEQGSKRENVRFDVAQVNHYALRSRDSFLVKRDRGRVNHSSHTLGLAYWQRFDINDVEDRSIARYRPARDEWMQRLFALDGVRQWHDRAVAWHRERIAALKEEPAFVALIADIDRHRAASPEAVPTPEPAGASPTGGTPAGCTASPAP